MTTYRTIEIDGEEKDVTVYYQYHRASVGATDGRHGPKLEMDEPAYVEIESVEDEDGNAVQLGDDEIDQLEESIMDDLVEKYVSARERDDD